MRKGLWGTLPPLAEGMWRKTGRSTGLVPTNVQFLTVFKPPEWFACWAIVIAQIHFNSCASLDGPRSSEC